MVDSEPKNALLTRSDRKFLRSGIQNTDSATTRRYRIRQRVRQGINDFRILAENLEDRDREQIFDVESGPDHFDLAMDVAKSIQFFYVGLNGEATFRGPLKLGVSNGEKQLGNIDSSFHAIPRFEVDRVKQTRSNEEIVHAIQSGELDQLEAPDLFAFIRRASDANAIDFERIGEVMEFDDEVVPPREDQSELEEYLEENAELEARREELNDMLGKALRIGLEELEENGEVPEWIEEYREELQG